jgi:RND family efflux transporter MFP subunit
MNKQNTLLALIGVAIVAAALWLFLPDILDSSDGAQWGDADGRQGPAVAVEVGLVAREDIIDVASYTGTLQAGSQFTLAPKVTGRVRSLLVDIGDEVEPGQVIARLDDEEFALAVAEQEAAADVTRAELEDARAQREVRRRSYQRIQDLRSQGLASESEYDVSRSEFSAAEARVRVAEAQHAQRMASLRAAQVRLSYTEVRAEWNGAGSNRTRVVGERFVDEGANVSANEPLISVLDTETLRAVVFVTDRDFARMRPGQPMRLYSDAWPGEAFTGTVQRIAPLLRDDTRAARVEGLVPNPDRRLSPGFFVNLAIEVQEIPNALVVPEDAITRQSGQRGLYLVAESDDGERIVRWVPVTTGVRSGGYVQIIEPEIQGEVVTLGQHRLSDGTRIRIPARGGES